MYPDMKTVIVGTFEDGVLLEGRPAKIVAERCKYGMKEILVSAPHPKSSVLRFKRNNHLRVHQPTIMDPFEKNSVYIRETMGKGEGLFARRDIEPREVVSYYSGVVVPPMEFHGCNSTGYERYLYRFLKFKSQYVLLCAP